MTAVRACVLAALGLVVGAGLLLNAWVDRVTTWAVPR